MVALVRLLIVVIGSFVSPFVSLHAQEATEGSQGVAAGVGVDNTRILIVAENPSIDHRVQPNMGMGAPSVTSANFWRVTWSPVGPGTACFITVNEPTPNAQKFVITDNPELAAYISSAEVLERLIPDWNDPPFQVIEGTITQTNDGVNSRIETCSGGGNTVELKWTDGLSSPRWIDFPFARQFGVIMTLSAVNSGRQEIVINGKRAPGEFASGFLALNETWRVEAE